MTAGFGLEKLGLLAQRFPRITLLIVAALTIPLAFAAAKVEFSSDIREIFRSGTEDFRNLQMVEKQYPQTGEDVLLLVQAPDLFSRENLEHLRDLHLNLHFVEGVKHVTSMFSAHDAPDASGNAEAVFPMELDGVDLPSCVTRCWRIPLCQKNSCRRTPRPRCSLSRSSRGPRSTIFALSRMICGR
ncbi:hypothetical protein AUC70_14755 [Methyloceanibacter stevinii]|uniref:Membrane transport protein MMPL domain-containing protein n=1 Tax=Methyloceanibacter stevinii TaxID=1774970 RepID=A0A1E3VSM4_9HYPH|nr:hypothetical protein [Methyloceanibacter stevinii]ODR96533.1 hypothetical protein AUC70_14755 [Methyloceanibacter stevinii]